MELSVSQAAPPLQAPQAVAASYSPAHYCLLLVPISVELESHRPGHPFQVSLPRVSETLGSLLPLGHFIIAHGAQ